MLWQWPFFKFADDVRGWAADWKGAHAVVNQLVHVSTRDMVPAGRMSAECSSTEERIFGNRKAFRKSLRPIKDAWRLSIVGVFWEYTSFGYSSLTRDQPLLFCLFLGSDSARFYLADEELAQTQEEVFVQLVCLDILENRQIRFADPNVH